MNPSARSIGRASARHGALLFSFSYFLLLLPFLAKSHLLGLDESIYANVALAAARDGSWMPFRFEGNPFFEKPPLGLWLQALSMRCFGWNTWAARLPSAVAGALCVFFVWKLAARIGKSEAAGFVSAAWMALSEHFILFSRVATLDMMLTACLLGGWWELLRAFDRRAPGTPAAMTRAGLWISAGLLVKSFFALAFLPAALAAFAFSDVRRTAWRSLGARLGVPLLSALASWFILYGLVFGRPFFDWELGTNLSFRLVNGALGRLFHTSDLPFQSWQLYAEIAKNGMGFLWPLLPLGLGVWVREARTGLGRRRADPVLSSGLAIFGVYLLALLFVLRPLINYLLPLVPLSALCLAALWRKPPSLKSSVAFAAAVLLATWNGFTRHAFTGGKVLLSLLPALSALRVPDTKPHHWGRRLRWGAAGLLLLGGAWKAGPYLAHPPDPNAKWVEAVKQNPARTKDEVLLFYGDPVDARCVRFYCDYRVRWTDRTPVVRPREAMLFEYGGKVRFLPALNGNVKQGTSGLK